MVYQTITDDGLETDEGSGNEKVTTRQRLTKFTEVYDLKITSIKSSSESRRVILIQEIDEWSRCNTKSLTQKDIQKCLIRNTSRLLISAGQFGTKNDDIVISDVLDISWT